MKVAIVHDWLTTWAGAEKALAELLACYPQAEIFTTVNFLPVEAIPSLAGRKIHTSFIQRLPGARQVPSRRHGFRALVHHVHMLSRRP